MDIALMIRNVNLAKINLPLNLAALACFIVTFNQELTGEALHEWFGLALGTTLFVHFLLHGTWIVNVTKKFLKPLPGKLRLSYFLSFALLLAFGFLVSSGILISDLFDLGHVLNFNEDMTDTWSEMHESAANLCLVLVGLHLALQWKWIFTNLKRCFPQAQR